MIAVLASGQSLTDEDVEYVRHAREDGKLKAVIAISDVGLLKAPWADVLVSHDSNWWIAHSEALKFKGRKFSARGYRETEGFDCRERGISGGCNSGLMGMFVARDILKASKLVLLGFDMHGTHFFGKHTAVFNGKPLTNTDARRFKTHIAQFNRFDGCEVINCTPGSNLKRFACGNIHDII